MSLTLTHIEYKDLFRRMPVIPDAPVGWDGDLFSFKRYVDPLVSILVDPAQATPFTIGIFGPWGSGKSTVLKMLTERLGQAPYENQFVRVEFNPWLYKSEANVLIPLLNSLRDALEEDPKKRFASSVTKIAEILFRLSADLLMKTVTADQVSLEKLERLEQAYFQERGRNDSIIRKLRKILHAELKAINNSGAKVVLFIDDLDRCDPSDIINVLEAVKLFLDLEYVYVIFALDRDVVTRGIQIRYKDFKFTDDRAAIIGNEYLEKMIQLPIELFPLDAHQISGFLKNVCPQDAAPKVVEALALLEKMVYPNPRQIKRLLNSFAVMRALMFQQELESLDAGILLRLVVLQVQYPELYMELTRQPKLLIALEQSYQGKINPHNDRDFTDFEDSKSVQEFCKRYWRPTSVLSGLFSNSTFQQMESSLITYMTMLGEKRAEG